MREVLSCTELILLNRPGEIVTLHSVGEIDRCTTAAEVGPIVWGSPPNFNGFHVLAALLHGTPVLGVSQTLRRRTQGATYIRQGAHHVGHRPTF